MVYSGKNLWYTYSVVLYISVLLAYLSFPESKSLKNC
jgi:hypothetical protein